jgi:hypothetical protein
LPAVVVSSISCKCRERHKAGKNSLVPLLLLAVQNYYGSAVKRGEPGGPVDGNDDSEGKVYLSFDTRRLTVRGDIWVPNSTLVPGLDFWLGQDRWEKGHKTDVS